jgi:hypothetical protein
MLQIVGQLVARGSYLKQRNVPVAGTILITMQERIAAALVSLTLATVGAWYLFKGITLDLDGGGFDFVQLMLGLIVATGAAGYIWRHSLVTAFSKLTSATVFRFLRAVILSLGVQLATMMAYIAAASVIAPDIPLDRLVAAITLVMFAASVPISFAGWGVREMSAVAALGAIGMSASGALTVAVLIGLLSIMIAAALALLSIKRATVLPSSRAAPAVRRDLDGILMTVLPIVAAVLVFFQVHLPTQSGQLSVNLADPVAALGGVMFIFVAIRRHAPEWRVPHLMLMVAGCTIAITVSLLIGAAKIGWTQWALIRAEHQCVRFSMPDGAGSDVGTSLAADYSSHDRHRRDMAHRITSRPRVHGCPAIGSNGCRWPRKDSLSERFQRRCIDRPAHRNCPVDDSDLQVWKQRKLVRILQVL